jgi:Mrp family chromosome partitioning ATPase
VNKDLFLIPSGKLSSEPSELLLNEKLSELLVYLEEMYDYILMDTAPVNVITDGYIVSRHCDASLLVARYGITPRSEILTLNENSLSRKLKNPGIILNAVKSLGFKDYGAKYNGYIKKRKNKKEASIT